LLLPIGE